MIQMLPRPRQSRPATLQSANNRDDSQCNSSNDKLADAPKDSISIEMEHIPAK
jgi:hypothetical protein